MIPSPLYSLFEPWLFVVTRRVYLSFTFLKTPIKLSRFIFWSLKRIVNNSSPLIYSPIIPKGQITNQGKIDTKVGLIIHVYYIDIGAEILSQVSPVANYFEAIIITHSFDDNALQAFIDLIPSQILQKCRFMKVENLYRDSVPFIQALNSNYLSDCQVFLKLHTKKSVYLKKDLGTFWRRNLIEDLLTPSMIYSIILELAENSHPLWIVPEKWASTNQEWGFNSFQLWRITNDTGNPFKGPGVFPCGNMYWLNKQLSLEIRRINLPHLSINRFVKISLRDGSFEHAIERFPSQFPYRLF